MERMLLRLGCGEAGMSVWEFLHLFALFRPARPHFHAPHIDAPNLCGALLDQFHRL